MLHFSRRSLKNQKKFQTPLSPASGSKVSIKLSEKNVSFHFTRILFMKSSHLCSRKIKLKAFFHNKSEQTQETEQPNKEPSIKSKTSWEPKENHRTVETFIEVVNDDVVERFLDKNKLPKNSLTDSDKNTIYHFSKRIDLVITKADKGGTTVVLDVKDYIAKAIFYQKTK